MPRDLYPEHELVPIPNTIDLCLRCKVALVYTPNLAIPKCDKCGDTGRPGERYIRASLLEAIVGAPLDQAMVQPEDAVLEMGGAIGALRYLLREGKLPA